jgi:hypothetical protein
MHKLFLGLIAAVFVRCSACYFSCGSIAHG